MSPLIEWISHRVDVAIEKHGLIRKMTPDEAEFESLLRGRSAPGPILNNTRPQYAKRTQDQLLGDVNALFDKLCRVVRERDKLREQLNSAKRRIDNLSLRYWILCGVVGAEGVILLFVGQQLFSRLK